SVEPRSGGTRPNPVPTRVRFNVGWHRSKSPPGAQQPGLRRSAESRSGGRRPTPVPTGVRFSVGWRCPKSPLELSSQACGDPPSPGAGGADLPPVGWRCPKSPLELSSQACGDPSSPGAGGADPPPCPPESSLRGAAASPGPPIYSLYWTIAPWDLPPGQREPRRARPAQLRFGKSHWPAGLSLDRSRRGAGGLGLTPCPPDTARKAPLELSSQACGDPPSPGAGGRRPTPVPTGARFSVGWHCPKSPLELSSQACGDPPSPGAGGADLPPVGWRCPKSPLELSSQACGDPSSPGAGGADPPPCPPESSLRGAAASPGPPIYSLYWTIAPWDLPPGQREPRRARPAQLRFGKSHWGGPPAFPMAAMSSHGLGLIPCPPEWDSTPPGAQQPGLRRSAESRSGGRRPTPVPTGVRFSVGWRCPKSPLELSSQACGDPPSPGAGGADLPPVGWRCPKSPLELSSQACGDPSSPGAGGADPPPCPPESSLRGAAASPGPPIYSLYWTIAPWDLPPGQREPRRARPAQLRFGKSHWGGPPAFPMAAMSSHGLGLIPCPPEWDSTPPGAQQPGLRRSAESRSGGRRPTPVPTGVRFSVGWRCPKSPLELSSQACGDPPSPGAGGADLPPVGWRCPKSPLELSSQACGDPSSPGAGGADPPPCPPESSLRGAAASPGPPIYSLYWTIAPWDLPPGQREPRRARPAQLRFGKSHWPAGLSLDRSRRGAGGLGLTPCPPDTARKAPLELSSQACGDPPSPGAGGRRPTPVPTGARFSVGWHCPKSPLELSSQACGDPPSPGAGGADLPPVGWRCPKSPLELSSQACGDPSSPGAGGADPPPCPPESSLRGAAASPGPPIYSLYWTIAPWDLPPGQREPRRARPAQLRFGKSHWGGPPAFPMAAMSSHGLGLIPCPPEWDSTPPGAQQPGLRRSAESRSGGRRPTPVPTGVRFSVGWRCPKSPLELSSQACGDPPSPGAGGADLPPVGWRCPKSPLELSSQACGDPSSPGAGGADPPPCPPESSLRGAAASPGPPIYSLYWTIAPWDLPPGQREPRRARPAQLRFGKSHWGGPPAFPMAAMSSHGLGLIPCPPEWDSTPPGAQQPGLRRSAESRSGGRRPTPVPTGVRFSVGWRCPKSPLELSSQACGDPPSPGAGGADLPPVGWRCPKSPLELSSQACGDPSSPGAGGADPPPCPPESSLRGAAASPGPPIYSLYWTIAPWDLPPGQREPRRARPAQVPLRRVE
ncbi:hypothetical protein M9458_050832, partial [Cirrhinus mrigala]